MPVVCFEKLLCMITQFYDYLRYELNRSPLTVEAYRSDITQFKEWISPSDPEKTDFKTITANDVRAWLASMSRSGQNPRTLRRKIITLRTLFRWMMKNNLIKKSPLLDIPLPKIPKPLPDIIKPEEIETSLTTLKESDEEEPLKTMKILVVEILYSLGIRRAELIGINDEDISFSKAEIKVTGKRSKQRVVPVPQRLLDLIKKWQHLRDNGTERYNESRPLLEIKGKRISASKVYKIVHDTLIEVSARKKSPHALRHSFASGMLNGGAEIDSVKEFLGHASLATTQIYTHISLSEIKKAYSTAHPRSANKE